MTTQPHATGGGREDEGKRVTDAGDTIDDGGDAVDESASHQYVLRHDVSESKPLSVSIATAIGEVTGTDPLSLPPLGREVDADFDALGALSTTDDDSTITTVVSASALRVLNER